MNKFTDTKGREWSFQINTFTLAKVKRETGFDIAKAIEPDSDVLEELLNDTAGFFDVVCCLLEGQMREAGIDAEGLGEGFDDESVCQEVARVLIRAILSYFPKDRREPILKAFDRLWTATAERFDLEANKAREELEAMNASEFVDNIFGSPSENPSETS